MDYPITYLKSFILKNKKKFKNSKPGDSWFSATRDHIKWCFLLFLSVPSKVNSILKEKPKPARESQQFCTWTRSAFFLHPLFQTPIYPYHFQFTWQIWWGRRRGAWPNAFPDSLLLLLLFWNALAETWTDGSGTSTDGSGWGQGLEGAIVILVGWSGRRGHVSEGKKSRQLT